MSITAAMVVYNEEKRIEATLKSVAWCDEILVFDRNSTDRTREIAAKYTDKIFIMPNREFSPRDNEVWLPHLKTEWMLGLTASDVVHPRLARKLRALTDDAAFPYDVIHVPFRRFILGLETPRSPWYSELNPSILFRKSVVRVNHDSVHGSVVLDTDRHFIMPNSDNAAIYHLAHSTVDALMDRHMVYWRAEGRIFPKDKPLRGPLLDVLRAIYRIMFKRRTFLMGWDGIALAMAYLSYMMMRFVYIWEARSGKGPETYAQIRAEIEKEWGSAGPLTKN